MTTHFDLEDAINKAWQTSEDIKSLYEHYGDHPTPMTEDEVLNVLWGIRSLHEIRMEKLFDTYKCIFELDEYCTDPETLANRARILEVLEKVDKQPKKKAKK